MLDDVKVDIIQITIREHLMSLVGESIKSGIRLLSKDILKVGKIFKRADFVNVLRMLFSQSVSL